MMETKQCTKCGEVKPLEAFAKRKASRDGRYFECRECKSAYDKVRHMERRERHLAQKKANREANRERYQAQAKAWVEANRPRKIASNRARQAGLGQATPMWADRDAIAAIYAEAARLTEETGIPHHVDHIIPLKGRGVCGLHVPWNLRAIPAAENLAKSNAVQLGAEVPAYTPPQPLVTALYPANGAFPSLPYSPGPKPP